MALNIDKYATKKVKPVNIFARGEPGLKKALQKLAEKKKISYNEMVLRALRAAVESAKP